jgi:hypothetical protein
MGVRLRRPLHGRAAGARHQGGLVARGLLGRLDGDVPLARRRAAGAGAGGAAGVRGALDRAGGPQAPRPRRRVRRRPGAVRPLPPLARLPALRTRRRPRRRRRVDLRPGRRLAAPPPAAAAKAAAAAAAARGVAALPGVRSRAGAVGGAVAGCGGGGDGDGAGRGGAFAGGVQSGTALYVSVPCCLGSRLPSLRAPAAYFFLSKPRRTRPAAAAAAAAAGPAC